MPSINPLLEPVLDLNEQADSPWQWSLIEVEPAVLDELLDQLTPTKPPVGDLVSEPPACYLKSARAADIPFHPILPKGIDFVALPEVPLPALCTDNHVLGLKQRKLEHLNHLLIRPIMENDENIMANAPLFLPLRPIPSAPASEGGSSPYYMVSSVRHTLLGAIVPADYNLLFEVIKDETRRRFKKYAFSKDQGELVEFEGFSVSEFSTTSIRIPQKVAENEMFRQYPLICLPRKSKNNDFIVIPLEEDKDLAVLAMKFFPLLEAHIKKVFEDSGRETVAEFSFFTALYILGCAVDDAEYSFFNLLPPSTASTVDEGSYPCNTPERGKLAEYETVKDRGVSATSAWIRDPFVACQLLRFLVTSDRNGVDSIIPASTAKSSGDMDYLSLLCRLEATCRTMSITQRTGYRMGMSELKIYYLISLLKRESKEISPQTLMQLAYGTIIKEKISAASLFPLQSHVELRIAPLDTSMKACKEVFSSMFQNFRVPDFAGAMTNARNEITVGTIPEKLYFWHWNIGMFGDVTKSVISGQLGIKQVPEMFNQIDKEVAVFMCIIGGKAFSLELPESVFASLAPKSTVANADKQASYVIFCDARSLTWNWETRLKDMYRMKRVWPLFELKEYIGPLLEHDPSKSLDNIIAMYLEPHPQLKGYYQNANLHLERP